LSTVTGTYKGIVTIYATYDASKYAVFRVTGVTNNSTYFTFAGSVIASTQANLDTLFTDGATIAIQQDRYGSDGANGSVGATGATGATGDTGATGATGTTGTKVTTVSVYQQGTSIVGSIPGDSDLDYTWATGALAGTFNSWTQTPPTVTAGNYLWETIGLVQQAAFGDATSPATSWTTERKVSYVGTDGSKGETGPTGSTGGGYTGIGISGSDLWVAYVNDSGVKGASFTLGEVVGPSDRIESTVDGGWTRLGNGGFWKFTGTAPQNKWILQAYDALNGGQGGFQPVPPPLDITAVDGQLFNTVNWNDQFLNLQPDGSTGSTGVGEWITGVTLAATGGARIQADTVKQADGTFKTIAQTPLEELGNATSTDTPANFNKVVPTFRAVVAGAGGYSGGGQLKVGQTGTFYDDMSVSGFGEFANDVRIEGNLVVDGSATIVKYPRMCAIGESTASIANTDVDLTWSDSTAAAYTVADGTETIKIGSADAGLNYEIEINCDGDYQIDVTARCNANNRIELFVFSYIDLNDGSGWRQIAAQQASNYAARDTDQNTGGTTLSTLFSMTAGQKLKFVAHADSDGTAVLLTNGTLCRIIKLPS
jgi:hypothetical protein